MGPSVVTARAVRGRVFACGSSLGAVGGERGEHQSCQYTTAQFGALVTTVPSRRGRMHRSSWDNTLVESFFRAAGWCVTYCRLVIAVSPDATVSAMSNNDMAGGAIIERWVGDARAAASQPRFAIAYFPSAELVRCRDLGSDDVCAHRAPPQNAMDTSGRSAHGDGQAE
jgi:hypothetical protein